MFKKMLSCSVIALLTWFAAVSPSMAAITNWSWNVRYSQVVIGTVITVTVSVDDTIGDYMTGYLYPSGTWYGDGLWDGHPFSGGSTQLSFNTAGLVGGNYMIRLQERAGGSWNSPVLSEVDTSVFILQYTGLDNIVITNNSGNIWIRNGADLSGIASATYGTNITAVAVQSDDDIVVAYNGTYNGMVSLLNGITLSAKATDYVSTVINRLAVQSDGDVVFVSGSPFQTVYLWDGSTLGALGSAGGVNTIVGLGVQSDGDIVVGAFDVQLNLLNGSTLAGIGSWYPGWGRDLKDLAVQSDGDVEITYSYSSYDGYHILLDGVNLVAKSAENYEGTPIYHLDLQSDDDIVLVETFNAVLRNAADSYTIATSETVGSISAVAIQPDGDVVLGTTGGDVWLGSGSNLSRIAMVSGFGNIKHLVIQSDGDIVVANDAGNLYLLSGTNMSTLYSASGFGTITGLALQTCTAGTVTIKNNLVTELLNGTSPIGTTYDFYNPREGWVFFSSTSTTDLQGTARIEVHLNSPTLQTLTVHQAGADRTQEAMRYMGPGWHALTFVYTGDAHLQSLIVRAIPEIIYSEFGDNPQVPQYGPYDLAFLESIGMLKNINTIEGDGSNPLDPYSDVWHGQGKKWLADRTIGYYPTAEEYRDQWIYPITIQPSVDGVMIDEFMQYTVTKTEGANLLLHDPRFAGKLFYPYSCSPSPDREDSPGLGVAFHQLVMDHNGHPTWERYLYEHPTEQGGRDFFTANVINDLNNYWLPSIPDTVKHTIMCFGSYISAPPDSLNQAPGADFKVWMDIQYNTLANDPIFSGQYGLMEWTSGHADEENIRWVAKLYRHYAIEGNTGMLSPQYGFTYNLTHIQNADFDQGTTGWTLERAVPSSIFTSTYTGYGSLEGRYPLTSQGDKFLVMRRRPNKPNKVLQTITGLVPGKLYSLKLLTGDRDDLMAGMSIQKTHAVAISISDADLVSAKCFQHVFRSQWHAPVGPFNPSTNPFWVNYHVRVFRAQSTQATLTIADWITPGRTDPNETVDQSIAYNFVEVQPYLE